MINTLKRFFGLLPETDFRSEVNQGAVIVDVRTAMEYRLGHIKGSLNIPLQDLSHQISKIPKGKTIITCCASGIRSASAKGILRKSGFENVHNGGGWQSLQSKIN
jgi:phage shock protein E